MSSNVLWLWRGFDFRRRQNVCQKLKLVENVFDILCQSADELNSFNSLAVLLIFTTKTINLITSIFLSCASFLKQNGTLSMNFLFNFLFDVLYFVTILSAGDSPVNEVRYLLALNSPTFQNHWIVSRSQQVVKLRQQIMNIPKARFSSNEDHLQVSSSVAQ